MVVIFCAEVKEGTILGKFNFRQEFFFQSAIFLC